MNSQYVLFLPQNVLLRFRNLQRPVFFCWKNEKTKINIQIIKVSIKIQYSHDIYVIPSKYK